MPCIHEHALQVFSRCLLSQRSDTPQGMAKSGLHTLAGGVMGIGTAHPGSTLWDALLRRL